ncbi:hypothetical protein BJV78DRAFT_1183723 [Lactifluus subvellereus]|nr:hypothetical protein BJV78DRAFT_1183723 [Lactifluus subvellereus]
MSNSPPVSPTDPVPPPSYQISQEEFDQKTSQAIQLSSSASSVAVDEDGWPIYNAAAFEAVVESYEPEHSPPASSSAGIVGYGADSSRPGRQKRPSPVKLPSPTHPMKSKNPERRRRSPQHDRDFPSEHRVATPPPPFTPTGPSLDGPPFEEVVRLSYNGSGSRDTSPLEPPYPPSPRSRPLSQTSQPVAPLRVSPHRFSDPQTHTVSNPHPFYRPTPIRPDVPLLPNPTSTITRVEFDPQMAYSRYGDVGNHTSIQAGATAFYNHAVAAHLATSPTMPMSTQPSHPERYVRRPTTVEHCS